MKRLLPLFAAVTALAAIAVITVVAVGASSGGSDKNADRQGEDSSDGSGVAAMCVEGVPDCNDMVVEPADGSMNVCVAPDDVSDVAQECSDMGGGSTSNMCVAPNNPGADGAAADRECSDMIDGATRCAADAAPECQAIDSPPPADPGNQPSAGRTAYDITIPFNASVTEDDTKLVLEIVLGFDSNADLLVLESFPPIGRVRATSVDPGFCAAIESKLESIPSAGDVTCAVAPADAGNDADPDDAQE